MQKQKLLCLQEPGRDSVHLKGKGRERVCLRVGSRAGGLGNPGAWGVGVGRRELEEKRVRKDGQDYEMGSPGIFEGHQEGMEFRFN